MKNFEERDDWVIPNDPSIKPFRIPKEGVRIWGQKTLVANQQTKTGFIKRMTAAILKQARALLG